MIVKKLTISSLIKQRNYQIGNKELESEKESDCR